MSYEDPLYKDLQGKILASASISGDGDYFTLKFQDDTSVTYKVEGDCCSHSWIEHLTVPGDVEGAILLSVDELGGDAWDNHVCEPEKDYSRPCGHDHLQVYNVNFNTNRGTIVLEFRNDSNGYYGGYLVRL